MPEAFPVTQGADTFTRANANPLDGNWTNASGGGGGWWGYPLELVSNRADVVSGNPYGAAMWNTQYGSDIDVWIDANPNATRVFIEIDTMDVTAGGSPNGYEVQKTAALFSIYRIDSGVATLLASVAPVGGEETLGFRKHGSTIELWSYNGSAYDMRLQVTDATYNPTYITIGAYGTGANDYIFRFEAGTNARVTHVDSTYGAIFSGFTTQLDAVSSVNSPAGDLIVVGILYQIDGGGTFNGFTDTAGDTFLDSGVLVTTSWKQRIGWCVTTGHAANVISAHASGSAGFLVTSMWINVFHLSEGAWGARISQSGSSSSGTSVVGPTLYGPTKNGLSFGTLWCGGDPTSVTPTSGYTEGNESGHCPFWKIHPAAPVIDTQFTATLGQNLSWGVAEILIGTTEMPALDGEEVVSLNTNNYTNGAWGISKTTAGTNRFVRVSMNGTSYDTPGNATATYGGVAMTKMWEQGSASGVGWACSWGLVNPPTTACDVVVSGMTGAFYGLRTVESWQNVHQTEPYRTPWGDYVGGGTPTISVPTRVNEVVIDGSGGWNDAVYIPAGQIELAWQTNSSSYGMTSWAVATASAVTMTRTGTTDYWTMGACVLNAVTAALLPDWDGEPILAQTLTAGGFTFSSSKTSAGADRYAVLLIQGQCATPGTVVPTYGGAAMTELYNNGQATYQWVAAYGLVNPSTSAQSVTIGGTFGGFIGNAVVITLKKVHQTVSTGTSTATNGYTSSTPTIGVAAIADADLVIDGCALYPNGPNVPYDQVQLAYAQSGSAVSTVSLKYADANPTTMARSAATTQWGLGGVALKAVSGGGTPTVTMATIAATSQVYGMTVEGGVTGFPIRKLFGGITFAGGRVSPGNKRRGGVW